MIMNRLLSLCLIILCAASPTARAAGRTIYYNGKVFTSNTQHLWAEGVAVEGELIIAVGTSNQVLALEQKGTKLVDLQGKTMIPGFNDAHVHPFDTTSFPRAVILNSALDFLPGPGPTLQEVIELIKRAAAKEPAGTWLMGSVGTNIIDDPDANRFTLQAAAPNHPVLLAAWFGHGTFLNTRAMEVIGIGERDADPFGGLYDRVPGSKVINGVAHEYAEHQIRRYFASQMTDEEFTSLYENFAHTAARMGYTSVQEMSIGLPQRRHVELLAHSDIPIRWRAICFPLSVEEDCGIPRELSPTAALPRLTASGIKWIVDGTDIERAALLRVDYTDAPGIRGHLNFPLSALSDELKRSITGTRVETQPIFHVVGDSSADAILDRMEAVAPDNEWTAVRARIEHGTLLRRDRYASAHRKGVFIVQNPVHFALDSITNVRFSPAQLVDVDPMRSLLDANIKVALGSDSVGLPGNPFLDLFFALIQPTNRSEALTIEQAVIAYTRTAAEAEFQERWKGTIEPGKLADLVVLCQDIFTLPPPAIIATRPLMTVVGGNAVYDAGSCTAPASAEMR
jgi:predicted amidohydrolase YtcJ